MNNSHYFYIFGYQLNSYNAIQNYPLLVGQQTNLYKCFLINTFNQINKLGYIGLVNPEGIFEDANGKDARKEVYQRLQYHFQFKNELLLFPEVHHEVIYGIHIFRGNRRDISFYSISNLFHPRTIDGCFVPNSVGKVGGIKELDKSSGRSQWNITPHSDRRIILNLDALNIIGKAFENSLDGSSAKLVAIHSKQILNVISKLSAFEGKVSDYKFETSDGWHETNSQDKGFIQRNTKFPERDRNEMIYSGPHCSNANPLYKTPKSVCQLNSDYDTIDLILVDSSFQQRTNYIPLKYEENIPFGISESVQWFKSFKLSFAEMLSITGERTLQPAILPPNTTHLMTLRSIVFESIENTIELCGITSSLVLDFFIKAKGRSHLKNSDLVGFILGIEKKYLPHLFLRTLLLNCITEKYSTLWSQLWKESFLQDSWSKSDQRLPEISGLSKDWNWGTPLRNYFERRQALVEIDTIISFALGLKLDELQLIYRLQFPVLQQNERETWYDQKGNIVFTCSKGLTGVGVDRPVWETIRDLKEGETFEHTIEKSELYFGKKVTYYAPFDKCDRVEDYRVTWAHFEKIFNE